MFLSIDIGTSSVKAGLVDLNGYIVKTHVHDVPSRDQAVEHNIEYVWKVVVETIKNVSKGYENKIEALVFGSYYAVGVLNKDYNVVANAITHLDRTRVAGLEDLEKEGYEFYKRTGSPPLFMLAPCRTKYLKERGFLSSGCKLTFVKDYVIHKLTGIHAIDYGLASVTGLMNIHDLTWDSKALEVAELDESMLPTLYEGSEVLEYVTLSNIGLEKVAIVPGSFDGALQALSYGIYGKEGHALLGLGSTAIIRYPTREPILDKNSEMRFSLYYGVEGYRLAGGASNNGMTAINWLKALFKAGELEAAEKLACMDGIYILPFIAGERFPFRDLGLKLTITGLRLEHSRNYIFRGLLEGIGFVLKYMLNALEENGVNVEYLHGAGGGFEDPLVTKVISDVLCKPIVIHAYPRYSTILGGAIAALKALSYIGSVVEAKLEPSIIKSHIHPSKEACEDYRKCFDKFLTLVGIARKYLKTSWSQL